MGSRLVSAVAALVIVAALAGSPGAATAVPSGDELSPQVKGWLTQMLDARTASLADFPTCSGDDADCRWYFPDAISFRTPAGVVFCTAFGAPATGTFNCGVRNVTFELPTKPLQPASQWHNNDIKLHDDSGWTLGNFVGQPSVADEANPLPYGTKLVLSQMRSQSGEAPKLECGSFTHGMVCLDRMWGKGFHASRDDFTPFDFPPTAP